jgi:hypothetical protein
VLVRQQAWCAGLLDHRLEKAPRDLALQQPLARLDVYERLRFGCDGLEHFQFNHSLKKHVNSSPIEGGNDGTMIN